METKIATLWIYIHNLFKIKRTGIIAGLYTDQQMLRFQNKNVSAISKVGNQSQGWPEGSLFDSYKTNV